MTAGNIVFGGLIGVGVDAASGAMNKYDPQVDVVMTPLPGCKLPKNWVPAPAQGPQTS